MAAVWEDGVDAVHGGRHGVGVADIALHDVQPRMGGQRRLRAVERADLVPSAKQLGHQVGADEAGACATNEEWRS